jgi:hypothetical protein
MNFLDALELRLARFAIPGLTRIIVGFNALVYVLYKLNHGFLSVLELEPQRIMAGEVWRLVSYIFIPQFGALLMPDWFAVVLYLGFIWFVGEGLEHAWGPFKLNAYYVLGMIGTTVAAFAFGSGFSNVMLNMSLFYAFARFFPETVIHLFYILPVKVKWMAWFWAAFLLLGFVTGTNSYRMALLAAFINYLIFFGPEIVHEARHRKGVAQRRRKFEADLEPAAIPLHECAVCHKTEKTDPDLDFRVADDGQEYCRPHLPQQVKA